MAVRTTFLHSGVLFNAEKVGWDESVRKFELKLDPKMQDLFYLLLPDKEERECLNESAWNSAGAKVPEQHAVLLDCVSL